MWVDVGLLFSVDFVTTSSLLMEHPKGFRELVIAHTVRVAIMKAINIAEDQYSKVAGDPKLKEDLDLDSLEEAEIVMSVEEMHNLDEIPEDYARQAEKISHIESYVLENCKEDLDKLIDLKNEDHMPKILLKNLCHKFNLKDGSLDDCKNIEDLAAAISKSE